MRLTPLALVFVALLHPLARADLFEESDGKVLLRATKGPDATAVPHLSIGELGALPDILRDARAPLLVAITKGGNIARLIVKPELRKAADGGPAFPVFVLDRFDTFDAADPSARIVRGREIVLFPGFQVDLDTGQVVPDGQGGDLAFNKGGEGPRLEAIGGTRLYTLSKLPAPDPGRPPMPTPGRAVVPADFAGRYRLFANGQWSGTLDLKAGAEGELSGQFRSDVQGSSYPVTGKVGADVPNRASLVVKFPRARGEFEGYLWTEGKGAIAGTFRLLDKGYGFFALREGGRFAPTAADVATPPGTETPARLSLEVTRDRVRFEGEEQTLDELAPLLKSRSASDPRPSATIRIGKEATPGTLLGLIRALEALGIATRIEPGERSNQPGP